MIIKTVISLTKEELDIVNQTWSLLSNVCDAYCCSDCPFLAEEGCRLDIAQRTLYELTKNTEPH